MGKTCNDCGGVNHFRKVCKSAKASRSKPSSDGTAVTNKSKLEDDGKKVSCLDTERDDNVESPFMSTVTGDCVGSDWFVDITFKLDTDAQANVLPGVVHAQIAISVPLTKTTTTLCTYTGEWLQLLGRSCLNCQ